MTVGMTWEEWLYDSWDDLGETYPLLIAELNCLRFQIRGMQGSQS